MSYKIDRQQRCVFSTLSGTVTDWDVTALVEEIWQDPGFDPYFARVVDWTDISETSVSSELCRAIAYDFRSRTRRRVAVVSTSKISVARRLAYIYWYHLKPADVARFFSRQEALRWLGVHETGVFGQEIGSRALVKTKAPR